MRQRFLRLLSGASAHVRVDATALALVVVLLGAVGFLPLFGQPGYEFALAAGLVLPGVVAVRCAWRVGTSIPRPATALLDSLMFGVVTIVIGALVALGHGLRAPLCEPLRGLAVYALGGGSGALMAAVWGTVVGLGIAHAALRRWRVAATFFLGFAGPALGIGVSLWRFYTSPMVFAFDPFFGYFAGPLYDTVNDPLGRLISYRVGSLMTILTCLALTAQLRWTAHRRLRFQLDPSLATLMALAACISLGVSWQGENLGHFSTVESIRRELSGTTQVGRCAVYYPPSYPEREALLHAADCEASLRRLEAWFELEPSKEKVALYLFASPLQKGELMGASRTYVAKPWRREVYLNAARFPHPVLVHELAHVVTGAFGQGPLAVAGPWWGLVPDPGRIEGYAVAAGPVGGPLTLEQSARAMLDLGILPPLEQVFALGFLAYNASASYAVAGAFVKWLHGEVGAGALRAWYAGASIEALAGADLGVLERRWHEHLATVRVSAAALADARAAFDRPAIFGRRCPRLIDRLSAEAADDLSNGAVVPAERTYRRILGLEPGSLLARLGLAACAWRRGDHPAAEAIYKRSLHNPSFSAAERANLHEALGDLEMIRSDLERAQSLYLAAGRATADEDRLRRLEVKHHAESSLARQSIAALLMGDRTGTSWPEAVEVLVQWSTSAPPAHDTALAHFLLAKNWYVRGKYELARSHLNAALELRPLPSLANREALRLRMLSACVLGDAARFPMLRQQLIATATTEAERTHAVHAAERCQGVLSIRQH